MTDQIEDAAPADEDAVDPSVTLHEQLASDAASDAHLVEQRRAELARLRAVDPSHPDIDHIAALIGEKPSKAKAKPESADKPAKAGAEQRSK